MGEEGAGDGCSWTSFDTPAYVRRGLAVEEMWLTLQGKLQHTWTEWSGPMGMLCSQLRHQADGLEKFRPWLGSDEFPFEIPPREVALALAPEGITEAVTADGSAPE